MKQLNSAKLPLKDENTSSNSIHSNFTSVDAVRSLLENRDDFRPFSCPKCPSRFKQAHHLTTHTWIHDGIKNYDCFYCDKKFRQQPTRDRHEASHRGDRAFECPTCSKRFITKHDLYKHNVGVHANESEKLYKCPHPNCDKSFALPGLVNKHFKYHSTTYKRKPKLKPVIPTTKFENSTNSQFTCPFCPKSYSSTERLQKHRTRRNHFQKQVEEFQLVENDKIHECPVCLECFRKIKGLRRHYRKHQEDGTEL